MDKELVHCAVCLFPLQLLLIVSSHGRMARLSFMSLYKNCSRRHKTGSPRNKRLTVTGARPVGQSRPPSMQNPSPKTPFSSEIISVPGWSDNPLTSLVTSSSHSSWLVCRVSSVLVFVCFVSRNLRRSSTANSVETDKVASCSALECLSSFLPRLMALSRANSEPLVRNVFFVFATVLASRVSSSISWRSFATSSLIVFFRVVVLSSTASSNWSFCDEQESWTNADSAAILLTRGSHEVVLLWSDGEASVWSVSESLSPSGVVRPRSADSTMNELAASSSSPSRCVVEW